MKKIIADGPPNVHPIFASIFLAVQGGGRSPADALQGRQLGFPQTPHLGLWGGAKY